MKTSYKVLKHLANGKKLVAVTHTNSAGSITVTREM